MSELTSTDFEFEMGELTRLANQDAYKLDDQLHVQFYRHAEQNSFRSREEGRKIFEEKVYIRIMSPADRLSVVERAATDQDKLRFSRQYEAFMAGLEQLSVGTPVSELGGISPAQVLELRALKVDTVEQLAGMPDTTVQLLGIGGQDLKRRAAAFLARTQNVDALAAQNVDLQKQISELQTLLSQRQAQEREEAAAKPAFSVTKG
jgi:hypothetical protein